MGEDRLIAQLLLLASVNTHLCVYSFLPSFARFPQFKFVHFLFSVECINSLGVTFRIRVWFHAFSLVRLRLRLRAAMSAMCASVRPSVCPFVRLFSACCPLLRYIGFRMD
jgi:hypothetical protein